MMNRQYAQNVKALIGIRRGEMVLQINYEMVTLFEAVYLLSNNKGYFDADLKCMVMY